MTAEASGPAAPTVDRIGFVGLGTMGSAMAANLVRAGFAVTVWSRSRGRTEPLEALGATLAGTLHELSVAADVVVVCVSDTPDVEEVLLGRDGVASAPTCPQLVIDCSTISPSATRSFAARLAERGIAMVDAPVSGGSEGALNGTLSIMVGGAEPDVTRARPVLAAMGRTITHVGPIGSGQAAKAVNQVMLCGAYLGVAEGLVLAMKAGLDVDAVVTALSGGAARSWVLENRSGRMIADEYPLGFKVSLHLKDLGIALALARENGVATPVAALAAQIENGLVGQGYGDEDMSALARAIRTWSGM